MEICEEVRNVPVLSPKKQALVSREIREKSLEAMVGMDVLEAEAKDPDHVPSTPVEEEDDAETANASAEALVLNAGRKKRKLYRQVTGSEVPWFPHDNDPNLLRELVWEAGGPVGCQAHPASTLASCSPSRLCQELQQPSPAVLQQPRAHENSNASTPNMLRKATCKAPNISARSTTCVTTMFAHTLSRERL